MGYFKNTTVWGGYYAQPPPPVTLVFIKLDRQNLGAWASLMCFLQKWH